jgi:hypothetical protein
VETTTLQRCYISAAEETLEAVVLTPKRLGRKLGVKDVAIWQQTSARHSALSEGKRKVTPAMAAGLTDRVWTPLPAGEGVFAQ